MPLYQKFILPRLIDFAMRDKRAAARRLELVPKASGAVLEVGIGSGLNLPFYTQTVTRVCGIDPSRELLAMARRRLNALRIPLDLLCQSAEHLPLKARSFDTAVLTWTLCSMPDPIKALREIRRVLKPDGQVLFVEHGYSPDPRVQVWQDRLTPIWRRFAGGCHLNRKIDDLLTSAGFGILELQTGYLPGPRPMTYTYQGVGCCA